MGGKRGRIGTKCEWLYGIHKEPAAGNGGWCTEGRRRSENIRFVIRSRYGKIKEPVCHFGGVVVLTATRHGHLENISVRGWRWLLCGFLRQRKRSYMEQRRPAGGATWASELLAVVLSAIHFYLAENVCWQAAQNVMLYKERVRSRQ